MNSSSPRGFTQHLASRLSRFRDISSPKEKDLKLSAGFTVVELLITLIVASVIFIAFTTTFAGIQNINKKATNVILASQQAYAKLQEYENLNYTSLPTTAPLNSYQQVEDFSSSLPVVLEGSRNGLVYISTVSNSLKEVLVRVTYKSGPSGGYIEYVTFIQKNGVGR